MRIWSLSPKYLDAKGLVAVWRETLLAQKVLRGETKGYRNHPQLERFKASSDPIGMIGSYLHPICDEAERRDYAFDRSKIIATSSATLAVTRGQLEYEWTHLLAKLSTRDPDRHRSLMHIPFPDTHPLFVVVPGAMESWERA